MLFLVQSSTYENPEGILMPGKKLLEATRSLTPEEHIYSIKISLNLKSFIALRANALYSKFNTASVLLQTGA